MQYTKISPEELEDIAFTLKRSAKLDSYDGWTMFQCTLVGKENVRSSKKESDYGEYSLLHDLRDVLQQWCDLKQNQATLPTLLDVLENCKLHDESEMVKESLGYVSTDQIPDFAETIKADENLQAHICNSITKNISTLSHETKINDEFLSCLKSANLNAEDMEIETHNGHDSSSSFLVYKHLWKEPWFLSHVISALEKTEQYRPSRILRRLYKEASEKTNAEKLMRNPEECNANLLKKLGFISDCSGILLQVKP